MIDAPIFPCHAETKAPLVATGFKAATRDPEQIARWSELYPNCLWGVPTGAVSGFDALDIDPRNGGDKWLKTRKLPRTRVHKTRSGGVHLLFKHVPGLRNSAGLLAPGVDVRADGGYIIFWPAHGFDAGGPEMTEWPADVLVSLLRGQPSAVDGGEVDLDRRMPPSADAVVDLLTRMENTLEVDRDVYVRVMTAAKGCIDALGVDEGISDAAIAWAERWPAYTGDEAAKWEDDWSRRDAPLAGWQSLQRVAADLVPGYRETLAAERLAEAQAEFTFEPLPPPPDKDAPLVYAYGENPYGPRRWLVHQMLPEVGVALLSGQWGVGKTFTAIELAVCAMFGLPFARHTVDRPCGVLWLAAEGETELSDRLSAALAKHGAEGPVPFVWADTFPLLRDRDAVDRFKKIIKAAQETLESRGAKLGVIFLDTMAAGAGWDDENSAAEGQQAMNLLRSMARGYGCLVVGIDHYGKDNGSGTRGSTAKEAACDAVLALLGERQPSGKVVGARMAVRKARGGLAGQEYAYDLPVSTVGHDEAGRPITTCTVAWVDRARPDTEMPAEHKPRPGHLKWHEALQTVLRVSGQDTCTIEDWRAECTRVGLVDGDDHTAERYKKFRAAKSDLATAGLIVVDGETVKDGRPDLDLGAL
jgi:AAA domain/Bifunctional DNA primase/polymerase, N-terminal